MPRTLISVPTVGIVDFRFTMAFVSLLKPPGTSIQAVVRSPLHVARNEMAVKALELGYDYVFFLDDDMILPPNLLERLIARLGADPSFSALAPRAYRRKPPHFPCAFMERKWPRYDPVDAENEGVIEVDAIHFAATLVNVSVFRNISRPWFEFQHVDGEFVSEDIAFSKKMKDAGMKLGLDTDLEVKHLSETAPVGSDDWKACREEMYRSVR